MTQAFDFVTFHSKGTGACFVVFGATNHQINLVSLHNVAR